MSEDQFTRTRMLLGSEAVDRLQQVGGGNDVAASVEEFVTTANAAAAAAQ